MISSSDVARRAVPVRQLSFLYF